MHYTEDEIKKIVMSGPLGNNSLYLSLKYRDRGIQDVPFVDVMNVSILAPDTIKITVYEKALAGYVKYLDTYMYFDKDGYVVESSGIRTQGVPQITGLAFNHIVLGEQHVGRFIYRGKQAKQTTYGHCQGRVQGKQPHFVHAISDHKAIEPGQNQGRQRANRADGHEQSGFSVAQPVAKPVNAQKSPHLKL